jgi:hypothetical protein
MKSQQLCAGTVAPLRGLGELAFQRFIDPEGKGGFAHVRIPVCVTWWVQDRTRPALLRALWSFWRWLSASLPLFIPAGAGNALQN